MGVWWFTRLRAHDRRAGVASWSAARRSSGHDVGPASDVTHWGPHMSTRTSTVRTTALLAAVGTSLLGVPAASGAVQGATAAAVTGTPIHNLPFYGSGDVTGTGTGTAGTAASNAAVVDACNGGPIYRPQWYRLPPVSFGKVIARVDAPFHPRGIDENATGVAFVSVSSGKVLACGSQPFDSGGLRPLIDMGY